MKRSAFLAASGGAVVALATTRAAAAAESDMVLTTANGDLYGTLARPAGREPSPVVLVIAGSGPVNRDGNGGIVRGNTYKLLASALAQRGIASLRYDKRGVGQSAAAMTAESDLRFDTYLSDAIAWVQRLASDKRFSGVTIAGHSEGSLIGAIASQQSTVHAMVSLEGAGRRPGVVLREQLKSKVPPALFAQADATIGQLEAGHTVANPPAELQALFRPSVQPYLISWFARDPANEFAKLRVPVTIVQGSADIQVSMADARALKAAVPSAQLVVVDGMNHMLKLDPDTSSMQAVLKGYEDPSLPIEQQVVSAIEKIVR